ncbi:uncharacterized protein AMSG_10480 [Thecamonas trahens ATCC 50062]|uniref:Uncharacterized protein n=1 Tax=Thecamonas trahens ATCC 50062 TaxID=461836 RepID=A0A0L0DSP9_THETB|nr:hypothetical protein AMSG_10480 [Thecamonas trahens ATCC 50062]KNC54483.1 hypothetical protein AMSG_10480 [Thecamonas trahens ATCC 50062]|eukprot:XP_013753637.1 hypothetical protein AMSG_10480 [Thecamonas trahens ATCC 50062]
MALLTITTLLALALVLPRPVTATASVDWAAFGIGPGEDVAQAVAMDENDVVYVVGTFHKSMTIQSHSIYSTLSTTVEDDPTAAGYGEMFVAAFDPDGTYLWAVSSAVTAGSGHGLKLSAAEATVKSGNALYITGVLSGEAVLGDFTLNSPDPADPVVVLIKVVPQTGVIEWATSAEIETFGGRVGMTYNPDNQVVALTSYIRYNATFYADEVVLSCPVVEQTSETCAVVVVYNNLGGITLTELVPPVTAKSWIIPTDIVYSSTDTTYFFTGSMVGCVTFDASIGHTCVPGVGQEGVFLAQYHSSSGKFVSAQAYKTGSATNTDLGTSVDVDESGNPVVVGTFRDVANFGSISYHTVEGSVLWAEAVASDGSDIGAGVHVTPQSRDVMFVGIVSGSVEIQGVPVNVSKGVVLAQFDGDTGDLEFAQVQQGTLYSTDFALARTQPAGGAPLPMVLVGGFLNETANVFDVAIIHYGDTPLPPAPPSPPTTTAVSTASSTGTAASPHHHEHVAVAVAVVFGLALLVGGAILGFIYRRQSSGNFPHQRLDDQGRLPPSARSANIDASLSGPAAAASSMYGAL